MRTLLSCPSRRSFASQSSRSRAVIIRTAVPSRPAQHFLRPSEDAGPGIVRKRTTLVIEFGERDLCKRSLLGALRPRWRWREIQNRPRSRLMRPKANLTFEVGRERAKSLLLLRRRRGASAALAQNATFASRRTVHSETSGTVSLERLLGASAWGICGATTQPTSEPLRGLLLSVVSPRSRKLPEAIHLRTDR